MPGIPTTIITAITTFADKENRPDGVSFKNRINESFNFLNDNIDNILLTKPVIENELPGPMTTTPVTPDSLPPVPNRNEQALGAAANAGLDLNVIADPGVPIQHHYVPHHDEGVHYIADDMNDDEDSSSQEHPLSLHFVFCFNNVFGQL